MPHPTIGDSIRHIPTHSIFEKRRLDGARWNGKDVFGVLLNQELSAQKLTLDQIGFPVAFHFL